MLLRTEICDRLVSQAFYVLEVSLMIVTLGVVPLHTAIYLISIKHQELI